MDPLGQGLLGWTLKSDPGPLEGIYGKSSFTWNDLRKPNMGPTLGSDPESLEKHLFAYPASLRAYWNARACSAGDLLLCCVACFSMKPLLYLHMYMYIRLYA